MIYALLNGKRVAANWAAELSDEEFTELRTKFNCVECGSSAYLNRGSSHQAAYFASRSHTEDCEEAYQGSSGRDAALVKANTIVLVIGSSSEAESEAHVAADAGSRRRTSLSEGGEVSAIPARRGANAILHELLVNPELATSSKKIVVGKVEAPASEFFVPFLQLGQQHIDRVIGVWGVASSFRELTSMAFLNRGDEKVDIRIPQSVFSQLKRRYHFTSAKELQGAKFLLIGTFDIHLGCRVSDARQLAIHMPDV